MTAEEIKPKVDRFVHAVSFFLIEKAKLNEIELSIKEASNMPITIIPVEDGSWTYVIPNHIFDKFSIEIKNQIDSLWFQD